MIAVGEQVPEARVWIDSDTITTTLELSRGRPCLLLFYVFDWTAT